MGFTYEDNSHDILSEEKINSIEVVKTPLLTEQEKEPNWEWIEKLLKKGEIIPTVTSDCFWVGGDKSDPLKRITGVFDAEVETGSSAVTDFMEQLKKEIESSAGAKKLMGKGGDFVITEMDIIAGASNHVNGSITPTMDNNYKPISITKGSEEDLSYDHSIDSTNYNTNMGYAEGRGEGVRDGLLAAFNDPDMKGFELKSDGITIHNYIIDTGGVIDEDNIKDGNDVNRGQVVLISMNVCWRDTEYTRIPPVYEKFNRCMTDLSVELNFNPSKQGRIKHACNNATFEVYVNDVRLTRTHYGFGSSKNMKKGGEALTVVPDCSGVAKGYRVEGVTSEYASLNNIGYGYEQVVDGRGKTWECKDFIGYKQKYGRDKLYEVGTDFHASGRWNKFEVNDDQVASLIDINNLRKYMGTIQVQAACHTNDNSSGRWADKREKVFVPNENFKLPKTNMVRFMTPDGPKTGHLYSNYPNKKSSDWEKYRALGDNKKSYSPNLLWIAIALKYSNDAGILPTEKGYIPQNLRDELGIPYNNITWLDLARDRKYIEDRKVSRRVKKVQKELLNSLDSSGKMEENKNINNKGCHEGVAEVVLNYYGNEQETELVTTPRFPGDGIINLGTPMEGCKKEWIKLVDASRDIAKEK